MNKFSCTLGDDRLRVELKPQEGNLSVVATPHNGNPTPASRLVELEIHEKTVRREMRVERVRVEAVEASKQSAHIVVSAPMQDVSVGLWLRVEDGELRIRIPTPEIYERSPALYRLFAVNVLPELMHAGPTGAMLMPMGSGAICHPRGKPRLRDRLVIYLEQERWEMAPLLPVCASWDDEHGAWMAMATEGDCDAQCRVMTDGQDHGRIGFATSLRRQWQNPVDPATREFRILPIPHDADPVVFTAKRLRRYLLEERGVKDVHERIGASPEVAYAAEALAMKPKFAQENDGLEMTSRDKSSPITFFNEMTFSECGTALKAMRDAGIEKIVNFCVGWNARGHDGMYPTRFPIDERLGGEAGFRELLKLGDGLGYHMSVHDNFMMNCRQSADFNPDVVTHDATGEPLVHGWWSGGIEYQSWPLALPYERLEGHLRHMKQLGVKGMYYCDYMMQPLEVNHHPRHRGPRAAHAAGQIHVWETAKKVFGAVATEFAPMPAAAHCDYVCYAGGRKLDPEWPAAGLIDRYVEVWPMVFKGICLKERHGHTWKSAMRAVLYGEIPRSEFGFRKGVPNLHVFTEEYVHNLAALDELTNARFGRLRTQEMLSWKQLDENVEEVVHEDGTTVVADFHNERLEVDGTIVERPEAIALAKA